MRPWHAVEAVRAAAAKYAGVFDEQPMPLSLAIMCGCVADLPEAPATIAAVTESWPQPAQSVDIAALVVADA